MLLLFGAPPNRVLVDSCHCGECAAEIHQARHPAEIPYASSCPDLVYLFHLWPGLYSHNCCIEPVFSPGRLINMPLRRGSPSVRSVVEHACKSRTSHFSSPVGQFLRASFLGVEAVLSDIANLKIGVLFGDNLVNLSILRNGLRNSPYAIVYPFSQACYHDHLCSFTSAFNQISRLGDENSCS